MDNYVSSIINIYGDPENATRDTKSLSDIIQRQGYDIVLRAIANHVGETCLKFKLNEKDSRHARDTILNELKELILERT